MANKNWYETMGAGDCLSGHVTWNAMVNYIKNSACTDFTIYSTCTSTGQAFKFTMPNPSTSVMYGGTNSGDDLYIYANDADATPRIQMEGGGDLYLRTTADIYFQEGSEQMFRMLLDSSWSYLYGSDDAGDNLRIQANPSDSYPYISLYGGSAIYLHAEAGDYISLYDGSNQSFKFGMNGTESTMAGGSDADDTLKLKANSNDTYPYILLDASDANDYIELHSGYGVTMHRQTHQMMRVASDGNNTSIFGSDNTSGDDLYIYANDTDSYPFFRMYGDGNVRMYLPNTHNFSLYDTSDRFMKLYLDGTTSKIDGGSGTGDDFRITANTSDTYPYINLDGNAGISHFIEGSDFMYIYHGGDQSFKFALSGDDSILEGGDSSGDDLILKANSTDTYPSFELWGNDYAMLRIYDNSAFIIAEQTTEIFRFRNTGNGSEIYTAASNNDLYLNPHGTGDVKFGTYAAITTETLQGYITIKDAAGNTRKLGVVA